MKHSYPTSEALKFLLQMAISVAVGVGLHMALVRTDGHLASRLYFPFGGYVNLGHFVYPWFVMMVIVATTNATALLRIRNGPYETIQTSSYIANTKSRTLSQQR